MKVLIRIILTLAIVFASTFILVRWLNLFQIDDIERWLSLAKEKDSTYIILAVILLLAVDLFIAIPTLSVCLLAGYFLGFNLGGFSALIGLILAGLIGYSLSSLLGDKLLRFIVKNKAKRTEAINAFNTYGIPLILLSRSSPILPEVSACMAGLTKMSFGKFVLAWLASAAPYAFVSAYAGSISTIENPMPAIYAMCGMYAVLWLAWFIYRYREKLE